MFDMYFFNMFMLQIKISESSSKFNNLLFLLTICNLLILFPSISVHAPEININKLLFIVSLSSFLNFLISNDSWESIICLFVILSNCGIE